MYIPIVHHTYVSQRIYSQYFIYYTLHTLKKVFFGSKSTWNSAYTYTLYNLHHLNICNNNNFFLY